MSFIQRRNIAIIAAVFITAILFFYTGPVFKDYYPVKEVSHTVGTAVLTEFPPAHEEVKPTEPPAIEDKPAEDKPAIEDKPAEDKPAEDKPAEDKPAEDKPAEDKPAEDKPAEDKPAEDKPAEDKPTEDKPAPNEQNDDPWSEAPISRLHYLIPASKANLHFCYNLVSSTANRWPIPTILGWHGVGKYDAHATHLAKLRTIDRYLQQLDPKDDDDLVVIVDGYDILLQLPPEIMIERYFEVVNNADAHLAKRFGISVNEARASGLRQTIFWGPDKICWPINWGASRCWAVPHSHLPSHAFGPKTDNGEMDFNDPRWLNSGTVMGPIGDMRTLISASMKEIEETYDPGYQFKESDQYYISNLWGRQEYYRSLQARNGEEPEGGPQDKEIPTKRYENQTTEYHVSIDYESALFQTKAGYERFYNYLEFSTSGLNAKVTQDMFGEGDKFFPFDIAMPANVYAALDKLYKSIADSHPGVTSDWIRTIKLGVNFITKHIFPLWHCTGPKEFVKDEVPKMWWFPYAKSLVKATAKAYKNEELITNYPVDGRKWASKNLYPENMQDELGGAWVDYNGATFVEWANLCGLYEKHLFSGEFPELLQDEDKKD
ncbi:hypothetical protein ACO1O0_003369 [Amphichorda felina]